jgi:aldose 1-epimerase
MSVAPFGEAASGEAVRRVSLAAGDLEVGLLTHGARIQDVRLGGVPLTLGTGTLAPYEGAMGSVGGLVAPVVNRLSGARGMLDGRVVEVEDNKGGLTLHSGSAGTHRKVWRLDDASGTHAALSIALPDGEAGFPGDRRIAARFEVGEPGALTLTVEATTDRPTWMNVANHSYWRLGGEDVAGHRLRVAAERYLPASRDGLVTGEVAPVEGPFDLREGRVLDREVEYDHNLCLAEARRALTPVAWLEGPAARMEVSTTEPGLQIYAGWKLADFGVPDHDGRPFAPWRGLAIEAQGWPDAPNHPRFPSIRLGAGETYRQVTRWRFATA